MIGKGILSDVSEMMHRQYGFRADLTWPMVAFILKIILWIDSMTKNRQRKHRGKLETL